MLNKVFLIGNLTRDVELRYTQGGSAIAKFGLAVNRNWKDRNTGEKREEVCYIDINIFGKSAEIANQHLAKGKRILVEGRLQFEQWEDKQSGQKRSKHSISAESFQFLEAKSDNQSGGYNSQGNGQSTPAQNNNSPFDTNSSQAQNNNPSTNQIEIDDDDIPF